MIVIKNRHTGLVMYKFDLENFDNAHLWGADFTEADLSNVVLSECNLGHAKFIGADLRGAVFSNTCLAGADFTGADMEGVKIRWCNLDCTQFGDICLTVVGQ